MSTTKKYDVSCKGNFLDKYPNFNHLLTGLDFTPFNKDTPDNMARYIVFLYSKDCPLHKEKFAFEDRQLDALKKFNIPITYLKIPEFAKNESASEAEWYDYITGLVAPLQVMQVAQNFNDKDKFGKDFLEVMLGLYGIGVQQYDTSNKNKKDSRSSGKNSDSRGTAR